MDKHQVKITCKDGTIIETTLTKDDIVQLANKGLNTNDDGTLSILKKDSEFNKSLKKILAYKVKK